MKTQEIQLLSAENPSTRLQAVLRVGTVADPAVVDELVARCAVEPDFFVRDMLTWALVRLPAELTVPRLRAELDSERAQARSQALHTLSKIKEKATWPAVKGLLRDKDDEVARTAWRTAVILVPDEEKPWLAAELATELGRGDRSLQLSLSRVLVDLGEVAEPVLRTAAASESPKIRAHARATEILLDDPDAAFDLAAGEAKRVIALDPEQVKKTAC
jgi:HEAT repeat protein